MTKPRLTGAALLVLALALVLLWVALTARGADAPAGDGSSPGSPASPAAGFEGVAGTAAVVERVVDGDTIVAEVDGERERIRLLNIDTPESVAEDRPVECLGPEAADFAKDLLSPGEEVRLVFDVEPRDEFGRMLAAVYTEDGRNVSVELARAGLAEAITVGENDRFRPDVQAAMEEAQDASRGLWDPDGPCSG